MGIMLVSKDTVAPWNTKVIAPVTRGLEGWFTFDSDAARFGFNRAPGKPNARVTGSPVAYSTHGRFTALANFLETEILDTASVTIIAAGKSAFALEAVAPTPDTRPVYASTFNGPSITPGITGSSYGVTLSSSNATTLNATAGRGNGAGGNTTGAVNTVDVPTDWGIRAMRASENDFTMIENLTRGSKVIGNSLLPRSLTANKFRIGSGYSSFVGVADISAIAIYSVALTDSEIASVAAVMRKRMARLGVVI